MFGRKKLEDRIHSLELQLANPAKHKIGDKLKGLIITKVEFYYRNSEWIGVTYCWEYTLVNVKNGDSYKTQNVHGLVEKLNSKCK